jgi:cell division protein ZapA
MRELSITVKIAERSYRLKINQEEEAIVRQAAAMINDKISEYSDQYAYNDKQDLLAMGALYFATRSLRSENDSREYTEGLLKRISVMDDILAGQLD